MRKIDMTPSPLAYSLPTTIGPSVPNRTGGPAFIIYGRNDASSFSRDLAKAPGPAAYNAYEPSMMKRRAPSYSLLGRARPARDINNVPGPGAYSPEMFSAHLEQSPRPPIGVRHSRHKMPVMTMAPVSD